MNTHSNTFPRKTARYLTGAALIVLLAFFLAPQAFSAKPGSDVCKPHPKKPDSCGPTGNGMPPGGPTIAELSGEFYEFGPRSCESEGEPMDSRGNYKCKTDGNVAMSFHELGDPVANRKSLSWMCNVLNSDFGGEHPELAIDSYIYGWTDVCEDKRCGVEIRLLSRDPRLQTITFGRSDQVEITLFAEASPADGDDYPFNESLDLDVESIETDYKKTGSTRSAVVCHHDVSTAPMPVIFRTDPN